ncbi:MAG: hypothetical protein RIC55_36305 [Pirellulaceae bacterium]
MKPLSRLAVPLLLLGVVSATWTSRLPAQAPAPLDNPIAIVSFSGIDAVTGDVAKLLTAVGADDEAAMVQSSPKEMVKGVDFTRPWGVLVYVSGEEAKPLMFAPITSFDEFLTSPALQAAPIPEMEKLEGGVTKINGPETTYVKEHNGWLFAAQEQEVLAALPDDPLPMLGGLDKSYDIAVRVYVQRVPESMRQLMKSQLQGGGGGLEAAPAGDDPFGAALQADDPFGGPDDGFGAPGDFGGADPFGISKMGAAFLDGVYANLDEFTYGLNLDGDAETASADITFTVVENSPAAARLSALEGLQSDHSGLLLPGSMFAMHAVIPLLPEDAEAMAKGLESLMAADAAPEDAADEDAADEDAARQKELAKLANRLVLTTVRSGKLDGGVALFAKPGDSTFVYGGKAGDADALREVMIEVVRQAQKEAGIPQDQFERIDYKGYRFVVVNGIKTADLDKSDKSKAAPPADDFPADAFADDDAGQEDFDMQEMFGEQIQVVLALNGGDHYLAMGTHAVDQVKAVIDGSQEGAGKPAAPLTLSFGMESIKSFGDKAQASDIPPEVVAKITALQGADRVLVRVAPAGRGATLRVELERQPLLASVILIVESIKNGPPGGFGAGGELPDKPAFDDGF